jgi:hypothetical protein
MGDNVPCSLCVLDSADDPRLVVEKILENLPVIRNQETQVAEV